MSAEQNGNKKPQINVNLDTSNTERLVRENEQLLQKVRDKEAKEELEEPSLESLKANMIKDYGNQELFGQATSKPMLRAIFKNFILNLQEKAKPDRAGSPLVEQQFTGAKRPDDLYTHVFSSYEEEIRTLREKARSGSKEAASYLDSFFEKHRELKMADPHRPEASYNPNTPEALDELNLVKKDGVLTPSNAEDGDLQALQRRWREMRKRRMSQNVEGNVE